MPNKAHFQQWTTLFQQQLEALGWPGERPLDSIEYQQYQQWLRTIEQYQSLDNLGLEVTLSEALRQLQQLTSLASLRNRFSAIDLRRRSLPPQKGELSTRQSSSRGAWCRFRDSSDRAEAISCVSLKGTPTEMLNGVADRSSSGSR